MEEVNFEGIPGILRAIDSAAKLQLLPMCSRIILHKKMLLSKQINFASDIIFVEEGWLYLTIAGVIVSILHSGETFFSPVISNAPNIQAGITLTAATPAVIIVTPTDQLTKALANTPEALFDLYARASRRNVRMLARMAQQHVDSLEVRLASILWSLGVPRPDGHRIIPAINQTVLASCLGTAREEVSRKRQVLVQQGLVFREGGFWLISAEVGRSIGARGFGE